MITTVTTKNMVSIPAEVGRVIGIKPGVKLDWQPVLGRDEILVRVIPDRSALARRLHGAGRAKAPSRDSVAELIREREPKTDLSAYLLDSSALLAHYRNEGEQVMEVFAEPGATLLVAAVTLAEFARRLLALGFSAEAATETVVEYRLLFDAVVDIDEAVALAAFDLGHRTPARLPLVDALIAAAAQSQDALLLHRDPHLAAIPQALVKQRKLASPADEQ